MTSGGELVLQSLLSKLPLVTFKTYWNECAFIYWSGNESQSEP